MQTIFCDKPTTHEQAFRDFANRWFEIAPTETTLNQDIKNTYTRWLKESGYESLAKDGNINTRSIRDFMTQILGCRASRKYSCIRLLSTPNNLEVPSLQTLITQSLLLGKTGANAWYQVWSSDEIWCLPTELRIQLFNEGTTIASSVKATTIRVYEREIAASLSNREAMATKKRCLLKSDDEKPLLRPSYEALLECARQLLSNVNPSAHLLKGLPVTVGSRAAKTQTDNHWLPLIKSCYGSLERFLFFFVTSPQGKDAFQRVLASGVVNNDVEVAMSQFVKEKIQGWQKQEQAWHESRAADAFFATSISRSSYSVLSQHMRLMNPGQAVYFTLSPHHQLPTELRKEEVLGPLQRAMVMFGSGWDIPWSENGWLDAVAAQDNSLLTVVEYLKARYANKGKWLRQIYEEQFVCHQTEERLELLHLAAERLTTFGSNKHHWEEFSSESDLWTSLDDASYLCYRWFKRLCRTVHRMPYKINDVPVSGLPSLSKVLTLSLERMVGQYTADGPYLNPMAGAQLADAFMEGYIPIGKVINTSLQNGTPAVYKGRCVDIQTGLTWLTTMAMKNSLLKLNEPTIKLNFGIWGDGCTCLQHPLFALMLFLLWEPETSQETEERWVDALRLQPIFVGILPETQETVRNCLSWARDEANQVSPLCWQGFTFQYNFKLLTGDFNFLRKATENVGGNGDFDSLAKLSSSEAADIGVLGRSSLLPDPGAESPSWLNGWLIGLDALHIGKGHFKYIINRLQSWSQRQYGCLWDDTIFNNLLAINLCKRNFSDLDGAHMRLLAMKAVDIIEPALSACEQPVRQLLSTFFSEWTEILWVLYSPPERRNFQGLQLRLHVLLFKHLRLLKELFPDRRKKQKPPQNPSKAFLTNNFKCCTLQTLKCIVKAVCCATNQSLKDMAGLLNISKSFSALKKDDLMKLCSMLREKHPDVQLPTLDSPSDVDNIDSIMKLYGHVLVAHVPDFYEKMDFKNALTERREAFFSFAKKVLKYLTSRSLTTVQPIRELFIRFAYKAHVRTKHKSSTASNVKKAFAGHKFQELVLYFEDYSTSLQQKDLDAFLSHLTSLGYKENVHWRLDEMMVCFNTLQDTETAFKQEYNNV